MMPKVISCLAVSLAAFLLVHGGCARFTEGNAAMRHGRRAAKQGPRGEAINRYLAATIYERQGQLARAIEQMQKAAELAPDSKILTLRLIRAYLRQEDLQSALAMAEKAVRQMPDTANLWVILGEIYHRLERHDDAVEAFNKAIAIDPGNIFGYGALVTLEENTNDLVAAVDIYQRLAELSPKSARVRFQLGLCYAKINDPQMARTELEKALELDPKLLRAHYVLGVIEMEAGNLESARNHLVRYLSQAPDDLRAAEHLAGTLAQMGELDAALDRMAQVVENPDVEPRMLIEYLYLLARAGKQERLLAVPPPERGILFSTLFRVMVQQQTGGDFRVLAESLDSVEGDLTEECNQFLNEILYLFGKEATREFLIRSLNEIRAAGVRSKTIDLVLGRVLIALDRNEEAKSVLREALERHPNDRALHYSLAIVNENLKLLEETEFHLKECLKIMPDDAELLNFLGYFYADHNRNLDEAEAMIKRALELDPKNGFYLDSLGWVYYRQGNADKAVEYIKQAILAMDNDDAELRNHLGDAYLLKGEPEKALAEWNRAHRLNPKLEGVAEKIQRYEKKPVDK